MYKLKLQKNVALFQDLITDQLDDLASRTTVEQFARNESILNEGDIGEHLYILESGSAKPFVSNQVDEELAFYYATR